MTQDIIKPFSGNWTGDATIEGAGDPERLEFGLTDAQESDTHEVGIGKVGIWIDEYDEGSGSVSIEYKTADTEQNCNDAVYQNYVGLFDCLGWVKIRLTENG